ncbi:MAG: hypothetical protein IT204_13690 [Fimbriimonadaceae bacterium]|nr:hypothetical protein [Fimbriimonadaceae bacterium]
MTERQQQERYWRLVEICLVEILGLSPDQAAAAIAQTRARWRQRRELGYHTEPFYTAVDLAHATTPRLQRIKLADRLWAQHAAQYETLVRAAGQTDGVSSPA